MFRNRRSNTVVILRGGYFISYLSSKRFFQITNNELEIFERAKNMRNAFTRRKRSNVLSSDKLFIIIYEFPFMTILFYYFLSDG